MNCDPPCQFGCTFGGLWPNFFPISRPCVLFICIPELCLVCYYYVFFPMSWMCFANREFTCSITISAFSFWDCVQTFSPLFSTKKAFYNCIPPFITFETLSVVGGYLPRWTSLRDILATLKFLVCSCHSFAQTAQGYPSSFPSSLSSSQFSFWLKHQGFSL